VRSRAGDKVEALALARAATQDDNAIASAWTWRGAVERASGDPNAALSSLGHALQIDPTYVSALKERAELRIDAKDYEHAIEDLKAALALKADDKQISIRLGNVYDLAGKPDEAQRIYQSVGVTRSERPPSGRAFDKPLTLINGTPEEMEAANSDDSARARPALEKTSGEESKSRELVCPPR